MTTILLTACTSYCFLAPIPYDGTLLQCQIMGSLYASEYASERGWTIQEIECREGMEA